MDDGDGKSPASPSALPPASKALLGIQRQCPAPWFLGSLTCRSPPCNDSLMPMRPRMRSADACARPSAMRAVDLLLLLHLNGPRSLSPLSPLSIPRSLIQSLVAPAVAAGPRMMSFRPSEGGEGLFLPPGYMGPNGTQVGGTSLFDDAFIL